MMCWQPETVTHDPVLSIVEVQHFFPRLMCVYTDQQLAELSFTPWHRGAVHKVGRAFLTACDEFRRAHGRFPMGFQEHNRGHWMKEARDGR
jgi:hypothetical protein